MLEVKVCECITNLVEKLSTGGSKKELDKKLFKELALNAG
jgi:hypothetical protein